VKACDMCSRKRLVYLERVITEESVDSRGDEDNGVCSMTIPNGCCGECALSWRFRGRRASLVYIERRRLQGLASPHQWGITKNSSDGGV